VTRKAKPNGPRRTLEPTWVGTLPLIVQLLQSREPQAVKTAMDELVRMAEAADLYNKLVPDEEPPQ
jgi:hypothetical protein